MSLTTTEPAWLRELHISLPSTPQVLLTGNVRDFYLYNDSGRNTETWLTDIRDAVKEVADRHGRDVAWVTVWDPVHGFILDDDEDRRSLAGSALGVNASTQPGVRQLATAIGNLTAQPAQREPGLLLVDFSARILLASHDPEEQAAVHRVFMNAESLGYEAQRLARFDRVVWVAANVSELPAWFTAGAGFLRSIEVPSPPKACRRHYADRYLKALGETEQQVRSSATDTFVDQTSGLTLKDMKAIYELARSEGLDVGEIEAATRAYRVGVLENPWLDVGRKTAIGHTHRTITTGVLPSGYGPDGQMVDATEVFESVVFGQDDAVRKASDILMRSALNLTSAHTPGNQRRPRGVLFFAGPTGVGKTQLAKAINRLVFDSDTPLVFDMSEFSSEHTEARLIGAPPGYIGHDSGGELTSAIRQNPFSVVLFDEIEKANPRILDKFLQILDEGRLTDGLGQTVYFSEALIIFTSNLGMRTPKLDANGRAMKGPNGEVLMEMKARPEDPEEFRSEVVRDIKATFVEELGRPELLNRIGEENIVVFDFISDAVARRIFETDLSNVAKRVADQCNIRLEIADAARESLFSYAKEMTDMGGRGVDNAVETGLVNPLARALFEVEGPATCRVLAAERESGVWNLEVEVLRS